VWLEFESPIDLKIYKTVYADRVPNEMIHVKSYIIDNHYCLGSVNLTNKGLWDNIESLVVFNSKNVVNKGSDEFLTLFKHPMLEEKGLEELGLAGYFKHPF
jgi:phosphatidylserine/phosphatidylglycerophosphate/cardiolipin synthase-like enzyme